MRMRLVSLSLLWLAVLVTALGIVVSKHKSRQLFLELQNLEADRDQLIVEYGRLQLEQSTLGNPGRVERLAYERLDMKIPRVGDTVIVLP